MTRTEMNAIHNYLAKYEDVESPEKEAIAEISSDFKLSYKRLKESGPEEVDNYFRYMSERLP
ncbi:hypothetical protein [Paenibacillus flagellatus]|uniref:Uncharacterized protein n=1 Tax=Paenibacillus flagellatus TaxID=2211139 RepID=A0A2V5JV41_9BACL|nr:hypothetical protein [Paenibacillus flagellatus]PYI50301.1 hypothetical protein DLM86_29980 [Paenibacillus flagellatus]